MKKRLAYWRRILKAYILPSTSHLTFWHGEPEASKVSDYNESKEYYMKFEYKAYYDGHFDKSGIPILDYHGEIGQQYNPIAIAQYGLGNYNLFLKTNKEAFIKKFLNVADYMTNSLELNNYGIHVWNHHFDFEYRDTLKSPWYSGLAQGLGLSVLIRAFLETDNEKYLEAHRMAWVSMTKEIDDGGVIYIDEQGQYWIEEYIVQPPTSILNGFIWAIWGVLDTWRFLKLQDSKTLLENCYATLANNLHQYDNGYWSMYDKPNLNRDNLASPFYHKLHIIQLQILANITKNSIYAEYANKWQGYQLSDYNKYRAIINKSIFKILHY
tara:strand:- start:1480 stop:2454 length:975 start_codon:yes stop_codon:yes gene_type:complete